MSHIPDITIARQGLSDQIAVQLRDLIIDGRLEDGVRINEVHLARQFGVSRTPLREALVYLAGMGFVSSIPGRGFSVSGLSLAEFKQLYAMRALLDPAALKMAGIPNAAQLDRLDEINQRLSAIEDGPFRAIDLDDEWHRTLLVQCHNAILLEEIERFMQRTRRYEYAYLRVTQHLMIAVDEHAVIVDALRAGELSVACDRLLQNMTSVRQPVIDWLSDRGGEPTTPPTPDS